jgi:hypothetical protein
MSSILCSFMTLLIREQKEESERAPFYMVKVFTKKDFDSE